MSLSASNAAPAQPSWLWRFFTPAGTLLYTDARDGCTGTQVPVRATDRDFERDTVLLYMADEAVVERFPGTSRFRIMKQPRPDILAQQTYGYSQYPGQSPYQNSSPNQMQGLGAAGQLGQFSQGYLSDFGISPNDMARQQQAQALFQRSEQQMVEAERKRLAEQTLYRQQQEQLAELLRQQQEANKQLERVTREFSVRPGEMVRVVATQPATPPEPPRPVWPPRVELELDDFVPPVKAAAPEPVAQVAVAEISLDIPAIDMAAEGSDFTVAVCYENTGGLVATDGPPVPRRRLAMWRNR